MGKTKIKKGRATSVIEALNRIASLMNISAIKVIQFVHPQLLVPMIADHLGIDDLEYGDLIFKELKLVCRLCEIYGGLTPLYMDTDLEQKEEYKQFNKKCKGVKDKMCKRYVNGLYGLKGETYE